MQKYLLIAIGGALGSIARFWVGSTIAGRMGIKFPYGTLIVNLTARERGGYQRIEGCGREIGHDLRVTLHEPAVTVPGEPRIASCAN